MIKLSSLASPNPISADLGERQPEVMRFFEILESSIENLHNSTCRLHGRLHPVLCGDSDKFQEKALCPTYSVPLVERLSSAIDRINEIDVNTNGIIGRLEI